MKGDFASILGVFLSLFDKEAREGTWRLAHSVPRDSVMRKDWFERLFDGVRQAVEKLEFDNKIFGTLCEKIVDYGDYFAAALYERNDEGESKPRGPKEASVVAGDAWMKNFFKDARERLKNADDKAEEARKIAAEFQQIIIVLKAMEETLKDVESAGQQGQQKEQKNAPEFNWSEFGAKLKTLLGEFAGGVVSGIKWADSKLAPVAAETSKLRGVSTKGKLW